MTERTWWQSPSGDVEIEHSAEAAAGVRLTSGERWWGTRISYRRAGARKWEHVLAVDVHPMDYEAVRAALLAVLNGGAESAPTLV